LRSNHFEQSFQSRHQQSMARSFLMSRPGLREGYRVPLRLNVFDTLAMVLMALWLFVSMALAWGMCRLQIQLGLMPRYWLAGALFPAYAVALMRWGSNVPQLLLREFGVLTRWVSRDDVRSYPFPDTRDETAPWPDEWQQIDPNGPLADIPADSNTA
jgi:hypothetical protein